MPQAALMPRTTPSKLIWLAIAVGGASAIGGIALHRGESINAIWFVAAAICTYLVAYRFYAAWICARVLVLDETRATPAERFNNGRDFVPTNRWVTFGHHFAAIAGPGPLIGPTLAMQFGYLPGTLWILAGAVLGGCVQDMVIMFCSTRRDGRSLGQMARDELGPLGGWAAMIGTMLIMLILIAVLGLVIVNAMKHSPWATSTVLGTIPVAMLIGIYMRGIRPGRVLEGSLIGIALLLVCVIGGGWVDHNEAIRGMFDWSGESVAWFVMIYGFAAATLPVWLLLAPRDYLSTFLKLGVVFLLAASILILAPEMKMPAFTQFAGNGMGPIFKGSLFPFVFITVACGAISGFHALVSSGTTPKLLANERDIRMIGYGSMALESLVGIMAVIAACVLDPGVYFAINSPAGVVGKEATAAVQAITQWGFPVTVDQMEALAREVGEKTLFARTGGAPSLAVGMATIFSGTFGNALLSMWYHFAIMFEVLFILTTLDAGTRVGRFMLQDILKHFWKPIGDVSSYPMTVAASFVFVAAWGYFLWQGVKDPLGGVNILWPLFGISNQLLAGIALSVATGILVKMGKAKYAWVTGLPLTWLAIICTSASVEKVFSPNPAIGFLSGAASLAEKLAAGTLPPERAAVAPQLIVGQQIDAALALFFAVVLWIVIIDMLRMSLRMRAGKPVPPLSEAGYVRTTLDPDLVAVSH
ncbi:MAG TPA: carbon starvation CstA family protein [Burkholderiales bacterium]|nr:carbon starvation CstA family protein [Burkholderiales bacterium]